MTTMTFSLHTIGCNFKSTSLENVALVQWPNPDDVGPFLKSAKERFNADESFFLMTCNRREFTFFAPNLENTESFKLDFLKVLSASLGCELDADDFYHHQDADAARHLFRVASSLDSMVLGETEIMKQIKDQMALGHRSGGIGRRLKGLLDTAIWSAKQVRNQTHITKNVVSMASLIFRKIQEHHAKRIVIVGRGHYVRSFLPTFAKSKDLDLVFVNRTHAHDLVEEFGGTSLTLDTFLADPSDFDAMVTATSASDIIFDLPWIKARKRPMLLLDAALPRDIDAGAAELEGVTYFDLSEMEDILARNRAAREAEIPKTVPIFDEGIERLHAHWLDCDLAGFSREISSHYLEAGDKALSHLIKEELPDLDDDQAEVLRAWTRQLVGKLTNIPILGLKGVAQDLGSDAVDAYTRQVAARSPLFRG